MSTATLATRPIASPSVVLPAGRSLPAREARHLRLTRRGRLLMVLAVLIAGVAALVATAQGSMADGPAPALATVVVQPGDTLWSVATAAMPGLDPREAVDHLRELNGLDSSVVVPGQALKVPADA